MLYYGDILAHQTMDGKWWLVDGDKNVDAEE